MRTLVIRNAAFCVTGVLAIALNPASSGGQVNVTTWHNDNWRTGQNTGEKTLTTKQRQQDKLWPALQK